MASQRSRSSQTACSQNLRAGLGGERERGGRELVLDGVLLDIGQVYGDIEDVLKL